jgi:hypothetical protein
MKPLWTLLSIAALAAFPTLAEAEIIGGVNYADDVAAYTSRIQNYGGTLMTDSTKFWATGAPDADTNGNGYAWDSGEPDYVAGWRTTDAGQYITVQFNAALADVVGDDLTVWLYGGSNASATVLASTDGVAFTEIGSISGGTPGYIRAETFDFNGLFTGDVHYAKVLRVTSGPNTGMFFDAFGGTAVPEPGTIALLSAAGLTGLLAHGKRKRKGDVS